MTNRGRGFRWRGGRSRLAVVCLLLLVASAMGGLYQISSLQVFYEGHCVDWSPTGQWLVSGREGYTGILGELGLFAFTNQMLIQKDFEDVGLTDVNSVRWCPTSNQVAVGLDSGGVLDELRIYAVNTNSQTFILSDTTHMGRDVTAVAWDPSGDYLAVGTEGGVDEVQVYHVASTGMTFVAKADLVPDMGVQRDALDWDPAGDHIVAGYDASDSGFGLHLYEFDAANSNLTNFAFRGVGAHVTSVDWAGASNLIAVGFSNAWSFTSVYIFEHSVSNTFDPVTYIYQTLGRSTRCVQWGPSDDALAVMWGVNSSTEFDLYSFVTGALFYAGGTFALQPYNSARWSPDGRYIAGEDANNQLSVFTTTQVDRVLSKEAKPHSLDDGTNVVYQLTVTNFGPEMALAVVINDELPSEVTFTGAGATQGSCFLSNDTVICQLGDIAVGGSAMVTIGVHVASSSSGVITNVAYLNLIGNDVDFANDQATNRLPVVDSDGDGDPDFVDGDDDGDGMSDDYESLHFGGRTNGMPLANNDTDPFNNLDEFIANTDPNIGSSFFRWTSISNEGRRVLSFLSATGRLYSVRYATDLLSGTWFDLVTDVPGVAGGQSIEDANVTPGRAYRLGVEMQ